MKKFYPRYQWDVPTKEKIIYLSFDDGPEPSVTPFVLDMLKRYHAKASFFCIGKNVKEHPALYRRIIDEGHATGNHTHQHLNGWKTSDPVYLDDVRQAAELIHSGLFRPPYGRIKLSQAKKIRAEFGKDAKIVMWSLLSGDFDTALKPEDCWNMTKDAVRPGSIVVFHDSEKAYPRLSYTLPRLLEYFSLQGYQFEKLG